MSYDVIVVGLGGMGSAAAYHLAARGQRVLGLERHTPAHDRGSRHGGSRIPRQPSFEDPAHVPLLLRSYELWEQPARDSGETLFQDAATCMCSNTPDRVFVSAQQPSHDDATVACGFSGHGSTFVPVVGEVLADLATTGATAHPIGVFDPRRPALATVPATVPAQSLASSTGPTLGANA